MIDIGWVPLIVGVSFTVVAGAVATVAVYVWKQRP